MKKSNVDKVKQAAALKYSPNENVAPKIVAIGKGEIANKIIEQAQCSDVPIYTDPYLASVLNNMQIGDEIPAELYEVVAQILVFVSDLDRNYG